MNAQSGHETLQDLTVHTVSVSAKTTWLFVGIRASDGMVGWGEATRFELTDAVAAEFSLSHRTARPRTS